jgi:hypothetical protein
MTQETILRPMALNFPTDIKIFHRRWEDWFELALSWSLPPAEPHDYNSMSCGDKEMDRSLPSSFPPSPVVLAAPGRFSTCPETNPAGTGRLLGAAVNHRQEEQPPGPLRRAVFV